MPVTPRPSPEVTNPARRQFLTASLAAGAALALTPSRLVRAAEVAPEGRKLKVAFVGIGFRGLDLVKTFRDTGMIETVAMCDVDLMAEHTAEARAIFPDARLFQDYREMFAKAGDTFEAVIIATPDFTHFVVAMHAMKKGKHVYVEKPLAHTFHEVELLMAQAAKSKVVTQMGNQGHSGNNFHQFKAWQEAGIIADVTRVDMFMNSPRRWHGWEVKGYDSGDPVPPTIDWNLWHANKPVHPYSPRLHPGNWRGWFAYGNGAFGDWGPHILDTCHRFLNLGLPHTIEAVKREGANDYIFPQATTIRFDFAARGAMPPVEVFWYDGVNNLPPLPAELGANPNFTQKNGKFIYSKKLTFLGGTHGDTLRIIPQEKMKEVGPTLPRITGGFSDHFQNFVLACLGREETKSPFHVSGPLSQVFILGVIAQRLGGKLEFDPVKKQFKNNVRANDLLTMEPPRAGWEGYYGV
ncbi:Gfo/Idh/MocA family oxidoreductase [Oleiharenicola lentus]|uniref:Gfo/Idh/MocA family oxidoreductase n=1 Tax=Oleiharenicola lentus TaxID=2508720 RepID=A0A4Q1CBS0_9BACT|nr:Gfo/Idh/MocA family oxidoreductase [Oleiharenicola lentus]RXK56544.1 Gfo/Idh/MocA family oxidoreductase [Oleiharenicola lentus]